MVELSVVVPAYEEEKRLPAAFDEMLPYLREFPGEWELLIVDDGSKDRTAALVREWIKKEPRIRLVRLPVNKGKGAAVREGMLAAEGAYRLFRDADSSTEMSELDKFLPIAKAGADAVIASRRVEAANISRHQKPLRELMGKGFTMLCRVLLVWEIRDYTCGFKLFSAKASKEIFSRQTLNRWAFDAEILYLAKNLGFKIVQQPVTWKDEEGSKVRMLKDAIRSFLEILQVLATSWSGGYKFPR